MDSMTQQNFETPDAKTSTAQTAQHHVEPGEKALPLQVPAGTRTTSNAQILVHESLAYADGERGKNWATTHKPSVARAVRARLRAIADADGALKTNGADQAPDQTTATTDTTDESADGHADHDQTGDQPDGRNSESDAEVNKDPGRSHASGNVNKPTGTTYPEDSGTTEGRNGSSTVCRDTESGDDPDDTDTSADAQTADTATDGGEDGPPCPDCGSAPAETGEDMARCPEGHIYSVPGANA